MIDFVADDGSLVILDPLKPQKDGRKVFQFNRVFGPLPPKVISHEILLIYGSYINHISLSIFSF